jgi:hypothetical protein
MEENRRYLRRESGHILRGDRRDNADDSDDADAKQEAIQAFE